MSYPTGVVLRTLTSGDSSALAGGMPLITELRVRPSRGLTYGGHPMPAREEVVRSALGEQASIELPVCDQSGHRDALTGAIIDVSAEGAVTHTYRVLIRWLIDGDYEVSQRTIAKLALPTGDLSPVDADALVDVPTVAGTVVSVPDSWSAQIEAIAASVPAEVEDYLTANPPTVPTWMSIAGKPAVVAAGADAAAARAAIGAGTSSFSGAYDDLTGKPTLAASPIVTLTQAAYDALTPDPSTLYFITI